MKTLIDTVEILSINIVFDGEQDDEQDYDFGSLSIKCEDREYVLDVVRTEWGEQGGFATVECFLEKDEETFPDNKYNITKEDLILNHPLAELYVGGTFCNAIENMTLFVKYGEMVKAINVEED